MSSRHQTSFMVGSSLLAFLVQYEYIDVDVTTIGEPIVKRHCIHRSVEDDVAMSYAGLTFVLHLSCG